MSNSWFTVFKKELARFFGDKRLVFTTVILPGLLIYVLYTIMGSAMQNVMNVDGSQTYNIDTINMPASLVEMFEENNIEIDQVDISSFEDSRKKLDEKEIELCIVFPSDFVSCISEFKQSGEDYQAPNVEIYYNSSNISSTTAYQLADNILSSFETSVSNVFDINNAPDGDTSVYDTATKEESAGTMLASMLPMLVLVFLYSACSSIAPDSIAGEKERGTIATLLITPIPRSHIAIGKIAALALISLLSGLSSFLGTYLSMPSLLDAGSDSISTNNYSASAYIQLVLVILSTVLIFVTLISVISAFAKTVKEATTLAMPLMMAVMFVSITTVFGSDAKADFYWYLIPVYNSLQSLIGIFSFSANPANVAISLVSNLVYSSFGVFALAKMFNNEKVIFGR